MSNKKTLVAKIDIEGVEYTLVNPTKDVELEYLESIFGRKVLKLNFNGAGFEVEGSHKNLSNIGKFIDSSKLDWEEYDL